MSLPAGLAARAALEEHLAASAPPDIDRVRRGFAPDATLLTPEGGAVRGATEIADWFRQRIDFFAGLVFRLERVEIEARSAAVEWWGTIGDRAFCGRDEFDVDGDGLIAEQRIVAVGRTDRPFAAVRVEVEPPILRIVLDRDEKRNAVSQPMLKRMTGAIAEAGERDDVRAVILAAEGRDFCAGEDVGGFEFPDTETARRFLDGPFDFFTAVEQLPKPVIAAVSGHALGFGSEVLLAVDSVYASPDATFGFAEIDHGAVPSVLVTRGIDCVFARRAAFMALSGRRLPTDAAVDARLVHRVADDPRAAAEEAATRVSGYSRGSVALVKTLLGADAAEDHDRARDFMPPVLQQVRPRL